MDLKNKCLLSVAIVFIVFVCGTFIIAGLFTDDTFGTNSNNC